MYKGGASDPNILALIRSIVNLLQNVSNNSDLIKQIVSIMQQSGGKLGEAAASIDTSTPNPVKEAAMQDFFGGGSDDSLVEFSKLLNTIANGS